jgi:hypothetical protein
MFTLVRTFGIETRNGKMAKLEEWRQWRSRNGNAKHMSICCQTNKCLDGSQSRFSPPSFASAAAVVWLQTSRRRQSSKLFFGRKPRNGRVSLTLTVHNIDSKKIFIWQNSFSLDTDSANIDLKWIYRLIQHGQGFCHSCRVLKLRYLPNISLRMFTDM